MSAVSRGKSSWAVPLLLLLAVLLAAGLAFNLANLDTGGEAVPAVPNAGGTSTDNAGLLDPETFQLVFLVAFTALAATAIVLFLRNRRRPRLAAQPRPMSVWDVIGSILGVAIFLALLFVWPQVVRGMRPAPGSGQNETVTETMSALPTISGLPAGLFFAGALAAGLLAVVWLLRLGEVVPRPGPRVASRAPRHAAAEAVAATIQELELGGDVRLAILACFDRFCRLLGERGVRDQASLTPRELEALAVRGLRVSEDSAEALTSLFEEARYSRHSLGEADRDRAVESLQRIRASLEA